MGFVVVLLSFLCMQTTAAFHLDYCELLDLSYPFDEETIYWPGNPAFSLDVIFKGFKKDAGFYYEANNYSAAEHGGTHIDAPSHFMEGQHHTEQIKPNTLIGEACVFDISEKAVKNSDYLLTVSDIQNWENEYGVINHDCIIVLRTGWEQYWPNRRKYLGGDGQDTNNLHFPGVSREAAQWLVDNRHAKAIGLDTASIDYGQSKFFPSHVILGGANMPIIENLMNLGKLPARKASIVALPMKIKGGSGGPVRVIAYGWNGQDDPCRRHNENAANIMYSRATLYLTMSGILIAVQNLIFA